MFFNLGERLILREPVCCGRAAKLVKSISGIQGFFIEFGQKWGKIQ